MRRSVNALGLAWWARVSTQGPEVVYWFGPFVRRRSLEAALPAFLEAIRAEGSSALEHQLLRTRRGEPLTETPEAPGPG